MVPSIPHDGCRLGAQGYFYISFETYCFSMLCKGGKSEESIDYDVATDNHRDSSACMPADKEDISFLGFIAISLLMDSIRLELFVNELQMYSGCRKQCELIKDPQCKSARKKQLKCQQDLLHCFNLHIFQILSGCMCTSRSKTVLKAAASGHKFNYKV